MIPVFAQQIIGTLVRAVVVFFAGWLVAHGGPTFTNDQLTKFVTEATPVVLVIAWSIWQKYRGRLKLQTAMASGHPISENHVEMLVASGQAPSVFTPKHEAPTLTQQPPPKEN